MFPHIYPLQPILHFVQLNIQSVYSNTCHATLLPKNDIEELNQVILYQLK